MKVSLRFLCVIGILMVDGCSTTCIQNTAAIEKGNKIGNKNWGISHDGVLLLEHLEGFRSAPYVSPNGAKTIGYGHEMRQHEHITYVSRVEAEDMLYRDVRDIEAFITREDFSWMDQGKCDALIVFIYNIGMGRFKRSRVYALLRDERLAEAVLHWRLYDRYKDHVTGKEVVSQGLRHRRMHEVEMFSGKK